jgi:glycosyltransferase involved in cell wall biosynthesis
MRKHPLADKIYFNGKYLTASPTGVHRVAEELIAATDKLISADPSLANGANFELVYPKNARPAPKLDHIQTKSAGLFTWIPWEQLDLPRLAGDGLCVSLCNLGPLISRNAVTMIHDAQVYSTPASYSKAFRLWYKTVQPFMGRRHRRILTVSEFSKTELVRYGVAPAEKIAVVPNGVDHVLRVQADPDTLARRGLIDKPFVLSLSNTQAHKNIGVLLKAFATARLQDVTLALFGSSKKADFEELGFTVPDNVLFLGRVSDGELAALMAGARAFACPSLTEGFGLPPLEAMLLGCPSVIAPCGALPEVCGDAALIADPHDPEAWSRQISRLVEDKKLAKSLHDKGLVQAAKFTWENAARLLLANIRHLDEPVRPSQPLPPLGPKPKVSMVMSTLGRTDEVRNFLESLVVDEGQEIEVIIVDENDTLDLTPIVRSKNWPFSLIHKKVPGIKGLSRGRNIGIGLATGDIICFPDDDCTYPPGLITQVIKSFKELDADIICGRAADTFGRSINGRFSRHAQWVKKKFVFTTQTEWLLFFRREALLAAGGFDNDIGLGASSPWQSAEGQDLTLRALEMGYRVYFDPTIIGHHPEYNIARPDKRMLARARQYGRGMGYVLGKHRFSLMMMGELLLRPMLGCLLFTLLLNFGRATYYANSALGRLEGYLDGNKSQSSQTMSGYKAVLVQ